MHCAILADTTAECWGRRWNAWPSALDDDLERPVINIAEIAIRDALEICARDIIGRLFCVQTEQGSRSPVEPFDPGGFADQIVANDRATCARLTDGRVTCWGEVGYVGHPEPVERALGFVETVPGIALDDVVHLAAGGDAVCALTAAGRVWCWGHGALGVLDPTPDAIRAPRAIEVDFSLFAERPRITALHVGGPLACAVLADRRATCWGRNPRLDPPDGEPIHLFDPASDPARPAPDRVFALDRLGER